MKASVRAAMRRIFFLLLIVCVAAFAWEKSRNSNLQPVAGQVIGTVYKGYTIGYQLQEQHYQFETRIGIFDSLGDLRSLSPGDKIPLLVNPASQHEPVINTLNGRYGITLSFAMLMLLFFVIMVRSAVTASDR